MNTLATRIAGYRIQYPYIESPCDQGFKERGGRGKLKKEDTWCEALGHYDAEYDSTLRVFKGWWHGWRFVRNRNSSGNLYVRYLNWDGSRWNWNYNWLDNDFNANDPAALRATLFISPPVFI